MIFAIGNIEEVKDKDGIDEWVFVSTCGIVFKLPMEALTKDLPRGFQNCPRLFAHIEKDTVKKIELDFSRFNYLINNP